MRPGHGISLSVVLSANQIGQEIRAAALDLSLDICGGRASNFPSSFSAEFKPIIPPAAVSQNFALQLISDSLSRRVDSGTPLAQWQQASTHSIPSHQGRFSWQ